MRSKRPSTIRLGPGLITGAADDDPSGIATYSQAGAQFGLSMLWTVFFTTPLMVGIQIVSARIGRVSGRGLAANIRKHYPPWILYGIVGLLVSANTINIAADISAMGDAVRLIAGGSAQLHALWLGLLSVVLEVFVPYRRYVFYLKWMTLTLFAYVLTVFVVHVPWNAVVRETLWPSLQWKKEYLTTVVAVFGTTISPYLFFWQASQEVEEQRLHAGKNLQNLSLADARADLQRIKVDTYVGMTFSNVIAFFIILATAVALNFNNVVDIQTSAQAAQALRPLAGELAFLLFSLGILGTGLLAVPVLAGGAGYAVAEALQWNGRLESKPRRAKGFYTIIGVSTLGGVALGFTPINPLKALYWSAVINGVTSIPIMALMMAMAVRRDIMGDFVVSRRLQILGWGVVAVMTAAVLAMLWTS